MGNDVLAQLRALGAMEGRVLIVHSAFSRVRPVEGGPAGLIAALLDAVGPAGTLVMPSMSDDDDHPFDAATTSCLSQGIVPETFRQMPGVLRSDSPHAFAAIGPLAGQILAPHPIDIPHGIDSPVGRAYEFDALVLLLGVGHDANTTVHLGEWLAGVRYRQRKYATVRGAEQLERVEYDEIDHCCRRFALVDGWLGRRQQRGTVGSADARLMRAADVVEEVVERLLQDEMAFLHPVGECGECDRARGVLRGREGA